MPPCSPGKISTIQRDWRNEETETHLIIIGVLVNEAIVFKEVFRSTWCIFFPHPFLVECMDDETKSLFTHGTTPVDEGIGCLNSKYQQDQ